MRYLLLSKFPHFSRRMCTIHFLLPLHCATDIVLHVIAYFPHIWFRGIDVISLQFVFVVCQSERTRFVLFISAMENRVALAGGVLRSRWQIPYSTASPSILSRRRTSTSSPAMSRATRAAHSTTPPRTTPSSKSSASPDGGSPTHSAS